MENLTLHVDSEYCMGCLACEVACKQENSIPAGLSLIRVKRVGPSKFGDTLRMHFAPVSCRQCSRPPCVEACPEAAIRRRTDGVVLIDDSLCIGCKVCLEACPFGSIEFDAEAGVARKCTLCAHLLERGVAPACVRHCPADCMSVGDINEVARLSQQRAAEDRVGSAAVSESTRYPTDSSARSGRSLGKGGEHG